MNDHALMGVALGLARDAAAIGEVPVGAVVTLEGRMICGAFNRRESHRDPCGHAELIAIREAARILGRWRLTGTTLYVTLEPCVMCAGALVNARIDRLVYAATDPKAGAVRSLYAVCEDERLNHRVEVDAGLREDEASALLKNFFREKRSPSAD